MNEQILTVYVDGPAPNEDHQLWVERDTSEDLITFDCPQCDYWRVVQGQPTTEQLKRMQLVAVYELQQKSCRAKKDLKINKI